MLSLFKWFLFAIFLGSVSGFNDNPSLKAKPRKNYSSKKIFTAVFVGVLEGAEAGIGFSILFTAWFTFLGILSSWIAPALHSPLIKSNIPQSFDEFITIAILPMVLGSIFGSQAGVSNYLLESESMLKAKFFASGLYTVITLSQFIIGIGTLLGFAIVGWSLLGNAQCTRDPRIHGGISLFLALAIAILLSNKWLHFETSTEKITVTIVSGSILFSCFIILDTLLLC